MTQFWTTNSCALNKNTVFTNWNAEGYRKALYTELFFIFLIYFVTQFIQSVIYKGSSHNTTNSQKEIRQPIMNEQQPSNPTKQQLPWHDKKWNRTFATIFSHHCVAVGMCILFSPFAGAVAVAYLHMFLFLGFVFLDFKVMILPARICRMTMDAFNLVLILVGIVGINLAKCNSDNTCPSDPTVVLSSTTCFG